MDRKHRWHDRAWSGNSAVWAEYDNDGYVDLFVTTAENHDSRQVESDIHKNAPEASSATTAGDYIPIIANRARPAAEMYASAGASGAPPAQQGLPGISFKSRSGGPREARTPEAIHAELGHGQPMDGSVRSQPDCDCSAAMATELQRP